MGVSDHNIYGRSAMAVQQSTDEIYHILEDEICSLKILPGESLSENQLCKRFGISRTPIRSVLQRLEQNHFVQIIPCKGTIVTTIDPGVVDQIIFQRVAVETMVFRDFAQSCSPMEIIEVEHLYDLLQQAGEGREHLETFDINHFLASDLAMHHYWFRKTGKEYLWHLLTMPQADYSRFIRLDIVGGRNVPSVLSEHREMLRILRERDLDAIEPLMRVHLYGGMTRMGGKIYADEYRSFFNYQ
jgi:DNA-binding GntR family transcriptional regulator